MWPYSVVADSTFSQSKDINLDKGHMFMFIDNAFITLSLSKSGKAHLGCGHECQGQDY